MSLAQHRRRGPHAARRVGQLDRNADERHWSDRLMNDSSDHVSRQELRIREDFRQVTHRSARHADRMQPLDPLLSRRRPKSLRQHRPQRLVMEHAESVGREPLVGRRFRLRAQNRFHWSSLPTASTNSPSEARRSRTGRWSVAVAERERHAARAEVGRRVIGQQRGDRVEQRDVDRLAAPRALAREQRERDALGREHARSDVGNRTPRRNGGPSPGPVTLINPPSACATAS